MASLLWYYNPDPALYEIGVDEAGRGPLFGRVYSGAVILPKDGSFDHSKMKDSKKFSSEKLRAKIAEYIKESSIAWSVSYIDEREIDKNNIRQATFAAMHKSISGIIKESPDLSYSLLIDGNDFKPYTVYRNDMLQAIPHTCITSGDNKYTAIAAASILAKVARDQYISELCEQNPKLVEYYNLIKNKGYGTKQHLGGLETYGVSPWHRRSYNRCKGAKMADFSIS